MWKIYPVTLLYTDEYKPAGVGVTKDCTITGFLSKIELQCILTVTTIVFWRI